jgi:hypothetical protein
MSAMVLAAQPGSPANAAAPSATAPSGGELVAADFASLVNALKGRWETLVYHEDPSGGVAAQGAADHGEQVWRTGPGGLTLMEEEHIASRSGDQYLLALHWWDRSTNTLKGMLCNDAGSGACSVESFYRSKLNWDGKRLTVDLVFPQGAKLMLWHEEFGDFTGTSFTQTGEMGEVGGPLKRVVTIRARKVGDVI